MQIRAVGLTIAATGAASQGAGIAVDAWLHAADATLAAREGVFSLNNVGHALLVVGVSLVVIGVGLALFGPWLYARRERAHPALRLAQWVSPVVIVGMLAGGTATAAQSSLGQGHEEHVEAAVGEMTDHHASGGAAAATTSHPHPAASHPATSHSGAASPSGALPAAAPAGKGHSHGSGAEAPNLPVKPATVLVTKVTIKGAKQAVQMFGPAQYAVAKAVADCVAEGTIPQAQADDLVIVCGVFIHPEAKDNAKILKYNYDATKLSIERAMKSSPTPAEVVAGKDSAKHPFAE